MKRPLRSNQVVFFVTFIFFTIANVKAVGQNSINGVVFDSERRPVSKIDVELLDEFERLIKSTMTASSGLYFFQGLRSGNYYIQVRVEGTNFLQAKERVQLGQGNRVNPTTGQTSGGESIQVNFNLEIRRNLSKSETPINNTVVFAQEIPQTAKELYESALKLLEDKKSDEAIVRLENAIQIFPDYYLALDKLGFEYLGQGKFTKAENIFKKELEINPKSLSAKSGLGIAQYKLAKRSDAIQTLEEAVIANPGSSNSFLFLGKIYREMKQFDRAEINLKKAKALGKNRLPDVNWELALLYYYDLKRLNEAADELDLYLKASPDASNKEQIEKLVRTIRKEANQKQ